MKRPHLYTDVSQPLVLAHQGASAFAPRNTFAAFDLALQVGADVLETDIHWSKDGVIVVCHDDKVDAMSEGTGYIHDKTFAELRGLDFGYQFTVDAGNTYPFRGAGIQIPTLIEVLTRYPNMRINVDIKPKHGVQIGSLIHDIHLCGAEARVGLASFHHTSLVEVRKRCAKLSTSASPLEVARFLTIAHTFGGKRQWPFDTLQVPMSQYFIPVLTKRFIELAKRDEIPIHVWTIDDEATVNRLFTMGVDGIVTNDPLKVVALRSTFIEQSL